MATEEPQDRSLIASIAAHESWAKTLDRSARTAPARAALDAKFLAQADGDPVRAAHLRKAHYQRLALKSAQARRAKKRTVRLETWLVPEIKNPSAPTVAELSNPGVRLVSVAHCVRD